ncbi:MAG: phosphate regulon transcriptional regulator PhoB [Methylophilaceae bacterium]|jgi:two-component system phosphate regulon response regulator PhoB|nr:phosphate regulon transcriptional regulator PhoB [Methylophilaceae bacterium]
MGANILIVEDEESILELIAINLHQSGFTPIRALNAEYADKLIHEAVPDFIILDWMLPGMSGIDFAKRLRSNTSTKKIPIIMLTAKSEEENMIKGLDSGADDYLTKPFSPRELVARIKAILRRKAPELIDEPIQINKLHLDPTTYLVKSNGTTLQMGPTEFRLLHFFMKNPDRVFSRNHILDKVWGNQSDIDDRTVDVHIKRLRDSLTLAKHHKLIQTVRGIGYRFCENHKQ